jgi:ankyrin repeat protein
VAKPDPKSLQLTPAERQAEQRDKQLVEAVKAFNQGKPNPGLPAGAVQVNPLEYWASLGNLGKVKLELQKGVNVNARGENGYTALHAAAQNGHIEVVRLLLSHNADRAAKLDGGDTPAELAKRAGHNDVVKVLEAK